MDTAEMIARDIRMADQYAAYDAACKRLLSEKRILAWIMKGCLEEYRDCRIDDIAEKYIEGTPQVGEEAVFPDEKGPLIEGMNTEDSSVLEGTVTYDIRFQAVAPVSGEQIGLIINMEAQGRYNPGYPLLKRGIYYCSRLISSQYGKVFTRSHFEKIKKVYSVWICMNPPKDRRNTITRYRMAEENLVGKVRETVSYYDLLSVIMVCLGGPENKNYEGVLKLLGTLLSNEINEAGKRKVLENEFEIPMSRKIEGEVSMMCNLSLGVEDRGIEKGMEKGINLGIEKGIAQGMEKGLAQGRQEERVLLLQNLMKNAKMPADQALSTLGIPETEWQKYRKLLAEQ